MGAWDATNSLFGNACSLPEDVTFIEMKRLIESFEELDRSPITAETLDRAWNRIGESGPQGRKYAIQFRPLFEDYYLPLTKQ